MAARRKSRRKNPPTIGLSRAENLRRLEIQSSWSKSLRAKRAGHPEQYEWLLPIVRSPYVNDVTPGCLKDAIEAQRRVETEDEEALLLREYLDGVERGLHDLLETDEDI